MEERPKYSRTGKAFQRRRVDGGVREVSAERVEAARAKDPGFTQFSYHAFVTDRDGEMLELEQDHRRHADIENTIRDLKYGVGLNHLPSGRFGANAAWLAFNVMAHNLARFATRIGLNEGAITTETLRRRYLTIPGRMTRSA